MRKLDYGIKVSKRGYSVIDLDQERKGNSAKGSPPHMAYALAMPYLYGARIQIKRAASVLKQRPSGSVMECIHEISTLFEDLCTVSKYAERCGNTHHHHKLWIDVRNHIRHDIREELDNEDDKRKNQRAARLKLNPKLQTSIGFSPELIKVGETEIEISQISSYLEWAEKIIAKVIKTAKVAGQIK
jgi:hypothetical protein